MALSPMMQQFFRIKEENPDSILLYRVGDFYELYFDDAITASNELEITLTKKDCGMEEKAPMAGVPYHSITPYIEKLIEKGYKVAICEQLGTKPIDGKKVVEREVVRTITAGTLIDSSLLEEEKNNYIASIYFYENRIGVAWSDISTGEFNHAFVGVPIAIGLGDLLTKINPAEIICNSEMLAESVSLSIVKFGMVCPFTQYDEPTFDYDNALEMVKQQFTADDLTKLKKYSHCVCASGALVHYLRKTQLRALGHINHTSLVDSAKFMYIDYAARRNLELTENTVDGGKRGSLLWLIDKTSTKMGARKLRKTLLQPYQDDKKINQILDGVEELQNDKIRNNLLEALKPVADIERIMGKLSYNTIVPLQCLALGTSLSSVKNVKMILQNLNSDIFVKLNDELVDYDNIYTEIIKAIKTDASNTLKDGGIINKGYDEEFDNYKNVLDNSATIIDELEAKEKLNTQLKNLRIESTRNFGYYIEIPKSQASQVPFRYIRKQTLKNTERYTTEELHNLEGQIFNARDNAVAREIFLYENIIKALRRYIDPILCLSQALAELDMILSHAIIAKNNSFCKPTIDENIEKLHIKNGRHCVVEKMLGSETFVPNDINLDNSSSRIMMITGPNMAGKSVYMRQNALIVILAHIGCFVPAQEAVIPITDKIFTRVGASDDQSTGRSTFMVEMSEVSAIIEQMTDNSLLLLDEIGRGTSTYDGLSIAWSILEHLSKSTKAKVLFSTHYHELTELEGVLDGVKNYKLTLKEVNNTIIFLRKIMRGSANRSFGIEVASLAGLPSEIVSRAKQLLAQLEAADIGRQAKMNQSQQISMFTPDNMNEIKTILKELEVDNISPRQALDILIDLKEKVGKNV